MLKQILEIIMIDLMSILNVEQIDTLNVNGLLMTIKIEEKLEIIKDKLFQT